MKPSYKKKPQNPTSKPLKETHNYPYNKKYTTTKATKVSKENANDTFLNVVIHTLSLVFKSKIKDKSELFMFFWKLVFLLFIVYLAIKNIPKIISIIIKNNMNETTSCNIIVLFGNICSNFLEPLIPNSFIILSPSAIFWIFILMVSFISGRDLDIKKPKYISPNNYKNKSTQFVKLVKILNFIFINIASYRGIWRIISTLVLLYLLIIYFFTNKIIISIADNIIISPYLIFGIVSIIMFFIVKPKKMITDILKNIFN
ncbi:MAG: hypothetical protein LBH40_05515 [Alphaproteobacteria bacterium]|jgi:hypothetical protein|nr:hypothetical protein [Alphaproteobacteria bacterium]